MGLKGKHIGCLINESMFCVLLFLKVNASLLEGQYELTILASQKRSQRAAHDHTDEHIICS